ncbi:MAG: lysylphosphatidylglycerol synthase domain-containing protein [Stellaceae bacterium]
MRWWAALFGLAGLGFATWLFLWQGAGAVFSAFAAAGFGILWASLFHLVPMAINAHAWQVLLPRVRRPSAAFLFRAVWLREAVNGLLPVARVGGEVASARLLIEHGMRPPFAVASLVVDMSLSLVTEFLFVVAGLALLAQAVGVSAFGHEAALGLAAFVPLIAAVFVVQRLGFADLFAGLVRRLFGRRFLHLIKGAARLDAAVRRLYRRRIGILRCGVSQLIGWTAGAGEIYLALVFLGAPHSLVVALIIESLIQGLSAGAFIVPGALGVQEGGFLALGELLGLSPEIALALALMRRARDLLIFVPAVLLWQVSLGRRLLRGGRRRGGPAAG